MAEPSPDSIVLDRSRDTWVGYFPGLGRIDVATDGTLTVEAESAAADGPDAGESAVLREQALRYGWGEAVSLTRRGFALMHGAAVCPPDSSTACLVLSGDPHDTAILILELTSRGWKVMADGYTPTRWQGSDLVAWPREAPLIFAARRLAKAGLEGTPVRDHTDSRISEVPRCTDPRTVQGICHLQMRKTGETALTKLVGHERFEAAATVMLMGALGPDDEAEPAQRMVDHMRLAALPHTRLRMDRDTADEDTEALVDWWHDNVGQEYPC